jgi:hypothetical protein
MLVTRLLGSSRHERLGGTAMKHFTTEEWIDFANEAVAKSKRQEMDRHLGEGCQPCKKTLSLWQKVRQTAKSAAECQPPENAVRTVKARFTGVRLEGKQARTRGLVEVLFDSFLQPVVEGARSNSSGAGSGMRQMLYRADPYQVDLQIEAKPGANKLVVTGQLLDLRNPDAPGGNVPVIISNLRGHVVQTVTNEFGEFREEIQSSSDLELKLLGDDDKAVIISLRDALGRFPDSVN